MSEPKGDVPVIPQHQAETMMAHMSWAIRNIAIVAVVSLIALVAAIVIFVNGYTSRTKDWLQTYAALQQKTAVTDGVQQNADH